MVLVLTAPAVKGIVVPKGIAPVLIVRVAKATARDLTVIVPVAKVTAPDPMAIVLVVKGIVLVQMVIVPALTANAASQRCH